MKGSFKDKKNKGLIAATSANIDLLSFVSGGYGCKYYGSFI